jgi:urease accessory protein
MGEPVIQGPASLPQLPLLQRARGRGRIAVRAEDGDTRLARLFQEGCGKIRLPRDAMACGLEAVLINLSGGLTGGDRMDWAAEAGPGARLTLTTQACEKVYRARDGVAGQRAALTLGADARLDWLPQETILFDGGALSRTLEADLAAGATLLAVEAVVLGRTAMDETVRTGSLHDRWRIRREGRLVFADDLRLDGPIWELAAAPPVLGGGRAFASLLLVSDDAERFLPAVRAALGACGGASAFDGKLFARLAAPDGFALRQALLPALEALRAGAPLPRVWRT